MSDVLDIIQRSLVLLGNANNFISETRRETALESIHPSLKKYGKGDFSNSKCDLFGQGFKDGLVKKVEADAALSKAVSIVARSVGTTGKIYQKQPLGQRVFQGAGPVGTVLCPAECTIRTTTRGKENTPQTNLTTGKAMCSIASAHARQIEPLQQLSKPPTEVTPSILPQA